VRRDARLSVRELAAATEENVRFPVAGRLRVSLVELPAAIAPVRRALAPKSRLPLVRLKTVNTTVPVGT
jgi:hypothetical protein